MDDCVIELNAKTGQMAFLRGARLLDSIWDTNKELQAFDQVSGKRYMVSVFDDRIQTRPVTLH